MEGLRHAALALSALDARDREWMLGQLPIVHRRRLQPLLDELDALGLAAEPDIHARLRDEEARRRAAALAAGDELAEQAILQLNESPADAIVRLFNDEPDLAVAALLAHFPWRWSGQALDRLEEARRSRIARLKPAVSCMRDAPWLALVKSMLQRVAACHEMSGVHA